MTSKERPTILELFLDGRRIDRAMRRAVRKALLRHKQAGVAIAVWRSGKVVRLGPSQIKIGADGSRGPVARRSSRARRKGRASGSVQLP